MSLPRIAIIGTGITALSIGHYLPLVNPLVQITFFDKGQKPGGRVATRRSRNNPQLLFDHGAPFLWDNNVQGDFRKVLDELGVVRQVMINVARTQKLKGESVGSVVSKKVLVGKNGLDSVPQAIFNSIKNVKGSHFEHRVVNITQTNQKQLELGFEQSQKAPSKDKSTKAPSFHQVFCCIPFPQAKLIKQQLVSFENYNNTASNYNAHWIVLLSVEKGALFEQYKDTDVIEFKNKQSAIKYAVKQNKKFEKLNDSKIENWAVYFTEKWTDENLNLTKEQVQQKFLTQILPQYSTTTNLKPQFITVHRWLYSSPKSSQVIKSPLISSDKRLVFAGDWVGSRQSVGECWALGREIVEQLYGSPLENKSKL